MKTRQLLLTEGLKWPQHHFLRYSSFLLVVIHHMINVFGDLRGGRFLVVGDKQHVFHSDDNCETWKHSRIPEDAGNGQKAIVNAVNSELIFRPVKDAGMT